MKSCWWGRAWLIFGATLPLACCGGPSVGTALPTTTTGTGQGHMTVDEPVFLNLWDADALGSRRVHFLQAEILHVPSGMVIDHIGALLPGEGEPGGGGDIGTQAGLDAMRYITGRWHPVTAVFLDPTCSATKMTCRFASSYRAQAWYLLAQVHITRPGHFVARGLRITYEVDGKRYVQTLGAQEIEVDSG